MFLVMYKHETNLVNNYTPSSTLPTNSTACQATSTEAATATATATEACACAVVYIKRLAEFLVPRRAGLGHASESVPASVFGLGSWGLSLCLCLRLRLCRRVLLTSWSWPEVRTTCFVGTLPCRACRSPDDDGDTLRFAMVSL